MHIINVTIKLEKTPMYNNITWWLPLPHISKLNFQHKKAQDLWILIEFKLFISTFQGVIQLNVKSSIGKFI
jgi:hypothetical protein